MINQTNTLFPLFYKFRNKRIKDCTKCIACNDLIEFTLDKSQCIQESMTVYAEIIVTCKDCT